MKNVFSLTANIKWARLFVYLWALSFDTSGWAANSDLIPDFIWARQAGGTGYEEGRGIAVDAVGSSYVVGEFPGTASFGSTNLNAVGSRDGFIAKYSKSGNLFWVRQAGAIYGAAAWSVATDGAGNAYVTGLFTGIANFGTTNLTNAGASDMFLAKYDADGVLLWLKRAGGSGSDGGRSVSVDSAGNAYVTGFFNGTATFNHTNLITTGSENLFVAKYDASGMLVWAVQAGVDSTATGEAVTVDRLGNCYAAGRFYGVASFGETVLTNSGFSDIFVAKYNPLGTVLWAVRVGGPLVDAPGGIAVDNAGNTYLSGYFQGNATFGSTNLVTSPVADIFVTKFGSAGNVLWASQASGSSEEVGTSIAIDIAGNSYVTGAFKGTTSFGATNLTAFGDYDIFVAKWDTAGRMQWAKKAGGLTNDVGYGIALDTDGSTYITGHFQDTAAFDGTNVNTTGNSDVFVAKIRGTPVLATLVDGSPVPGGALNVRGSKTISLLSTFSNGTLLFTLDGSDPSTSGSFYSGPFVVKQSATLRAIAYNSDFTQSVPSDPVEIVILPTLSASTAGGGSVAVDPPAGAYLSDGTALVTATPAAGWTFLQWLGDAVGTNPTAAVSMTRNKCVQAVFGTSLSNTVVGSGNVVRDPSAVLYPFGTTVRLTAVPQTGNYFALWGNAASGTNNPLTFTITNANPTVTAVFAALPVNQHALTVVADGFGQVSVSPRANHYGAGTSVTLTASPESGQSFIGWTGDAGGTANPLVVTMNASKVITATFTRRPKLELLTSADAPNRVELRLLITGDDGERYAIEATTHLVLPPAATAWVPVATVTNRFGVSQFSEPFATNQPQRFYRAVSE